jgi:transposase-like protein
MEALKSRESGPVPALEKYPDELRERAVRMVFEVRELRRANGILKSASTFFAAELDRPQQR